MGGHSLQRNLLVQKRLRRETNRPMIEPVRHVCTTLTPTSEFTLGTTGQFAPKRDRGFHTADSRSGSPKAVASRRRLECADGSSLQKTHSDADLGLPPLRAHPHARHAETANRRLPPVRKLQARVSIEENVPDEAVSPGYDGRG